MKRLIESAASKITDRETEWARMNWFEKALTFGAYAAFGIGMIGMLAGMVWFSYQFVGVLISGIKGG